MFLAPTGRSSRRDNFCLSVPFVIKVFYSHLSFIFLENDLRLIKCFAIIGSILEIREIIICCFTHRHQVTLFINYNNYLEYKQSSQISDLNLSLLHCFSSIAASEFNYSYVIILFCLVHVFTV